MLPLNVFNALNSLNSSSNKSQLNANLPMLLQVLSKKGDGKFLVQLGKLLIETTSNKELIIGAKYWANVQQGSNGIIINNLVAQPKMMQNIANANLKLQENDLKELLLQTKNSNKKLQDVFKDFLLDKIQIAPTKQDFLELANLLVALQNGVISLVIKDENNNKDSLLQMKSKMQCLDFYCIFQNLGQISGLIYLENDEKKLRMQVMSAKVKNTLESNLSTLKGFGEVLIEINESSPLWDLSQFNGDNILNIRA